MSHPDEMNRAFVDVAATLVTRFDVTDTLDRIVARGIRLCRASGGGLVLRDGRGMLRAVTCSDERLGHLEQLQLLTGEGPCVDCVRSGQAVVERDLVAARVRWPRFATAATEAGFLSVRALPLRHLGRTLGSLLLFDVGTAGCSAEDLATAQAFADLATLAVVLGACQGETATEGVTWALACHRMKEPPGRAHAAG